MKYLLDTLAGIIKNQWLYAVVEVLLVIAFIIVITVIVIKITESFAKKSKIKKLEISLLQELVENSRINLIVEREQAVALKSIIVGGSLVMDKPQQKEMVDGFNNEKLP